MLYTIKRFFICTLLCILPTINTVTQNSNDSSIQKYYFPNQNNQLNSRPSQAPLKIFARRLTSKFLTYGTYSAATYGTAMFFLTKKNSLEQIEKTGYLNITSPFFDYSKGIQKLKDKESIAQPSKINFLFGLIQHEGCFFRESKKNHWYSRSTKVNSYKDFMLKVGPLSIHCQKLISSK